ncbi:CAF17-like 4Fe-4S cluster assembly/insertion protein YgfZ [Loktanella sp. S4079]|uniref:CAF17-like 4Fe-4S cluster assembly/insertion protein YgfZ n=1 Tax=Loktanella sp. S4079 TaxID=579483 RepID=UPI0005FA5814|nr:folate-binding protein YgfZ [Loktanella sp. S4079]KJZ17890.1 aminomethyltransferase [Loktanella sp. S4079]
MTKRTVLSITGKDRVSFLQGLVTNDVEKAASGIVYTALLTPQGKYIADFFVIGQQDRLLIDVAASLAPTLAQRLGMYRLRADVAIDETQIIVSRGTGTAPVGALPDPRTAQMGWRHYGETDQSDNTDWDALRVAHLIPETGIELTADTYILEAGFEALNGVDFKKGCYVGQEIVARMKHKTTLRKGLARVTTNGPIDCGTPIMNADGKEVGTIYTQSGNQAIAYLRFDRSGGTLFANEVPLSYEPRVNTTD